MRFFVFVVLATTTLFACNNNQLHTKKAPVNKQKQQIYVSYTIEQLDSAGWAYRIQINGKPFIYQYHIPSVPGHQPIKTKTEAVKLAELMQKKIYQGYDLPYITYTELDSLNIEYTLD